MIAHLSLREDSTDRSLLGEDTWLHVRSTRFLPLEKLDPCDILLSVGFMGEALHVWASSFGFSSSHAVVTYLQWAWAAGHLTKRPMRPHTHAAFTPRSNLSGRFGLEFNTCRCRNATNANARTARWIRFTAAQGQIIPDNSRQLLERDNAATIGTLGLKNLSLRIQNLPI